MWGFGKGIENVRLARFDLITSFRFRTVNQTGQCDKSKAHPNFRLTDNNNNDKSPLSVSYLSDHFYEEERSSTISRFIQKG